MPHPPVNQLRRIPGRFTRGFTQHQAPVCVDHLPRSSPAPRIEAGAKLRAVRAPRQPGSQNCRQLDGVSSRRPKLRTSPTTSVSYALRAAYPRTMGPSLVSRAGKALSTFGRLAAGVLRSGERPLGRFNRSAYIAFAVVLLTAAAVVIGWLQYRHDTATADMAEVTLVAESNEGNHVVAFVVDASEDLSTLPSSGPLDPGCTPEQLEWLRAHGTLVSPVSIRMTNTGSADGLVRVADLRFERDETAQVAPPSFIFDCPNAGIADTVLAYLALGETQAQDTLEAYHGTAGTPGPIAFNLAAGEAAYVYLNIAPAIGSVSGDLVFEVTTGDETGDKSVTREDGERSFVIPGLGTRGALIVSPSGEEGVLHCKASPEEDGNCTPMGVRGIVARLAEDAELAAQVLTTLIDDAACRDPHDLGTNLSNFANGYAGPLGVGDAELPLLRAATAELLAACGPEFASDTVSGIAASDYVWRELTAVADQGIVDDSTLETAVAEAQSVAESTTCTDTRIDAEALSSIWSETLGANVSAHAWFEPMAVDPVVQISELCGQDYAYDVIVQLNVVDQTWRVLTGAIGR
jgi:hypothetical protein